MWDLLATWVVLAWTQSAPIHSTVHDHVFDRVEVESSECSLKVKLWFTAPESGYKDRSRHRNSYLFRARVKLDDGKQLTSGLFRTSKPGRKLQTWSHDTSAEGCWAKGKPPLRQVVVNGCRGKRCPVPELE